MDLFYRGVFILFFSLYMESCMKKTLKIQMEMQVLEQHDGE